MNRLCAILLVAGIAAAPAAAQIDPEDAENRIRDACKREEGTDAAKCDCYVDELDAILPAGTYEPLVVLAAAVMSGDNALVGEFLEDRDIDAGELNAMVLEMEQALATAELRCEAADEGE